jgi:hypothetical protein
MIAEETEDGWTIKIASKGGGPFRKTMTFRELSEAMMKQKRA